MRPPTKFVYIVRALVATGLLIASTSAVVLSAPKPAFASGSQAFSNTGGDQAWTVPAGVTEVQVYVRGAAGGTDQYNYGIGGKGAYVSAVLAVTPGSTLTIVAGSKGGNGASGINQAVYGGGGTYSANVWYTTSGGGASDIRVGGSALGDRVVVAGGGGGGVSFKSGGNAGTPTPGVDGSPETPSGYNAAGGNGATQSAGGAGGLRGSGCDGSSGSSGSLGQGGAAGSTGGGGGGGGYYGGGGGGMECNAGSGGGGSSWVDLALVSSASYSLATSATLAGCVEIAWPAGTAASSCTGTVSYSVTYNGNTNSSGTAPTDGTAYTSGQTVTVATNSGSLQKTGYTFNGWCTAQPAAGATCASVSGTSRATSSTFSISSGTTLYAVWTAASQTITYNNNLGTGTISDTTGNTGASVSLSSGSLFSRSGHTLAGWNTASGGGGTSYALSASITMPAGGLSLHAQWTADATTTTSTTTAAPAPAPTPTVGTTTTTSTSTTSTTTTTSTTVPDGVVGINSWTIEASSSPAAPGSRIVLTTTISCGRQMSTSSRPYYPSMYYMVSSSPWINGVYGRPTLSADRRTATFTVTVTAPTTAGTYQMYAYGRDNPFGGTCTGNSYNFSASSMFSLVVGDEDVTTTTSTPTDSASTTIVVETPTVISVPNGRVGINSWTIESSRNPVPPGSRIELTTTISCGRQMSTTSRPYYPSMYYLVNSPQRINGVYGRPTLSSDRRTATFTVTVTAPTRSGTYQMYAYGRDNPFGGTCTGDSYNFASSSVFSLTVGNEETTTTTVATLDTESTTTTILVMPTITTSTLSTTTTSSTTSTSTSSSTSTSIPIELPATSNPAPVVRLDIAAEIMLPENSTDFVITRDSLIAIVDNLKITNGIIRVKASDGDWSQFDIQNISDVVVPLGENSSSLEIEVLEEGSTTPVAYSVPISSKGGIDIWPTQVAILAAGIAVLWFLIFALRRRRASESR